MNYHKLSTEDCVHLFNSWLLEDTNQIGDIYERVERHTQEDDLKRMFPEMAENMSAFRFALRSFLAGFFIGQEDGLKLDEAIVDDAVEMVLGKHGLSQEGKALYDAMVHMGLVSEETLPPVDPS